MKIIADKNIPFLQGIAECYGETEYLAGADFVHEKIKDADVLIVRTVAHLDESVLANTNIKLICSATIGFDHIDTAYCDAHNIKWSNAPGCNSGSVQQYIVSVLLTLSQQKNFRLTDKTIGIIGVGNVGKKVARACRLLGMNVLLNDPPRQAVEGNTEFTDLETIKKEADIITFHTPLTKEGYFRTYHLADCSFFKSLHKKPLIINSARGGIIDTNDVIDALDKGLISGAVIDCWENEPDINLLYMNRTDIATPHIAGYSADGKANASRMALTTIANFFNLDKAPIERINPPSPVNTVIDLDNYAESRIDHAILETYNPMDDYERFKSSPDKFKFLRNEYPLRREYQAYTVINATEEEKNLLTALGFNC